MTEKDGFTELASLFKERNQKSIPSISTGIVISSPPNPQIRLNDVVILHKENLIFAASIVAGYERKIKFSDVNCGQTAISSNHNHIIEQINIDTLARWTDTIVEGDEVILVPVGDSQLYYVIDKAVRF
ncbi:hypothetical protein A0U40_05235 [[Bacillus] sp. KCTC 13219]|nr:hypothetical protein A0U40_05235 [[Bacillus] sp. KCTC 13219]